MNKSFNNLKLLIVLIISLFAINTSFAQTINIEKVTVSGCYYSGGSSKCVVSVQVGWTGLVAGNNIAVHLGADTKTIAAESTPAYTQLKSPQVVAFEVPSDGSTGAVSANVLALNVTSSYTAQTPCAPLQCNGTDLGGQVFFDYNNDGIHQVSEITGQSGVTVTVTDKNGLTYSTVTDANGKWKIAVPAANYCVRVEYSNIPAAVRSTTTVAGNTTTQFYNAATCNADMGVLNLTDYSQNNPDVYIPIWYNGDPADPSLSNRFGISKFSYTDNSSNSNLPGGINADISPAVAPYSQVGPTWGLAWSKQSKKLYAGATVRRHCGLGPQGLAGLYTYDPIANTVTGLDLTTLGLNFGTIGSNASRGTGAALSPSRDIEGFSKVGKVGIGGISIKDDGTELYVVNLFEKKIHVLNVPSLTLNRTLTIPDPGCNGGSYRPWSVKYYKGHLYVGVVCDAEASQNKSDMTATIFEMDPTSGSSTVALEFPLTYPKGYPINASNTGWYPWTDDYNVHLAANGGGTYIQYSTPILADIDFDIDGAMVIDFVDRFASQWGWSNYAPDPSNTNFSAYVSFSGGDVLRAFKSNGVFALENAGKSGPLTGAFLNNNEGPGFGEFFNDNLQGISGGGHTEMTSGGIAIKPGAGEVFAAMMDPGDRVCSGGVKVMSTQNGAYTRAINTYGNGCATLVTETFGKTNGLGDIEFAFDLPNYSQIGNRVWSDIDADGIQDPCEVGIQGITMALFDATGNLVSTTLTDSHGNYYFGNNVNGVNLTPGSTYYVVAGYNQYSASNGLVDGASNKYGILTLTNTGEGSIPTNNDNDGVIAPNSGVTANFAGFPYATVIAPTSNSVDHNFDFGFITCTTNAGPDMAACGGTCVTVTGTAGVAGTWTANSTNPIGATFTPVADIATICFDETASGIYSFIYSSVGGCSDTMNVTVNPKPNAGNDMSICGSTCQSLIGSSPTTGTWSAKSGNPAGATLGATVAGIANVCFSTIASGTYNFIYTIAGGCSDTMTISLDAKPNAGSDMVACGATCTNLVGSNPSNGTWSGMSTNPSGASVGAATAGTAEVCFDATADGTYSFLYTMAGGCSDTMNIQVTAKPIAGPDQTTCYINGAAVVTLAGSGVGTWSEQAGNPGSSIITSTSNPTTTITNFSTPGTYNYIFTNNFCNDTVSVIITPNGNVGNYVWNDHNNNGLNDEPSTDGINGITVELWKETSSGSNVFALDQSTTTANDLSSNPGYYNFMICETANYQVKFPTTTNSLILTTQDPTASTDGNSDASIPTGISPVFTIDVNGTGTAKNNPTIDAGYHLATPNFTSYPSNQYCFKQNTVLIATGVLGATFNWITPAGFTGTIDNSVSGISKITINNLTAADNGVYTVTQTFGTNTSLPVSSTINAATKPTINFVSTSCVTNMGQVTVNTTPSTGLEYSINGGPFQSSNVLTTNPGSAFIVAVRPINSSCEAVYSGECVTCVSSAACANPPEDSIVVASMTCATTPIPVTGYLTNASTGTWSSSGTGSFSSTTCSSSPCTVTYTPSAADMLAGNVVITYTSNDPDGAGPCNAAMCSKYVKLFNGTVAPSVSNNGPVCANSLLQLNASSAAGTISWTGPNAFTAAGDSVQITNPTTSMSGVYTATASITGCPSSSASTTVSVVAAPALSITATGIPEACFGNGNGKIHVTVTGGTGTYTICYNNNLSNCTTGDDVLFNYVAPGTYTVTVVDPICPNNVSTAVVIVPTGAIVPPPVVTNVSACEGEPITFSGTITAPATNILWVQAATLLNATGNPLVIQNATLAMNGTVYAKAIDINGCASTQVPINVIVSAKPVISHVQVNCLGTSAEVDVTATITGGGTLSYSLDGTNWQASNLFSGVTPGNLTLHVKESAAGCEVTLPISIPNCACPTAPVVNISAPTHSCSTTAIPVTGTFTNVSNATWTATGTGSFSTTSGASPLASNYTPSAADLALGHVYLMLTTDDPDGAGPCTPVSQSVYVILLDSLQTPVISTLKPSYCAGDTVVMVANGVNSYVHWTGVGGFVSDSTSAVLYNATQFLLGNYTATVTGNGCATKSSTYLLTIAAPPTLAITSSVVPENCEGHANGEITVNVSGGTGNYTVCDGLFINCANTTASTTFKYLAPSTYTLFVADASCPNYRSTITETVLPGTHVDPPTSATYNNPVCVGEDLILTATGPLVSSYVWTDMTNNFTATGDIVTRTNASTGMSATYKVQRVEGGCASGNVYVDVHVFDYPKVLSVDTLCLGSIDSGRLTVNATIAAGDAMEYSINQGSFQSSNVFDNLTNGLYEIQARAVGSDCVTMFKQVELYCDCHCSKEAIINVFPNPNNGAFAVNGILTTDASDISIAVYDMNGRTIYKTELTSKAGTFTQDISISTYANGAYMIKVIIDGEVFLRPIMISK